MRCRQKFLFETIIPLSSESHEKSIATKSSSWRLRSGMRSVDRWKSNSRRLQFLPRCWNRAVRMQSLQRNRQKRPIQVLFLQRQGIWEMYFLQWNWSKVSKNP
jgi:hypothetical protein